MKKALLTLTAVLVGCGILEPEPPSLVVQGTVTALGQPLDGARVSLNVLAGIFSPGGAVATATSGVDGRFEIRLAEPACGGFYFLGAAKIGYYEEDVDRLEDYPCPGVVDRVSVRMQPNPTLVVETRSLPPAIPTVEYRERLIATGGDTYYEWAVVGGSLPPGLGLWPSGDIMGTTTEVGTSSFEVEVTSGDGQAARQALSITVIGGLVLEPSELCSDHSDSAVATFEDAGLREAIRAASGVGPQEPLTCGVLSAMTVLDASDWTGANYETIRSLVGLQNLPHITDIDLSGAAVTDIAALGVLKALTALRLAYVPITDISPLSGLTGLTHLALNNTSISDISALSGLTSLTELDLNENQIADIDALSGLTSLTDLLLTANLVTDVGPLSRMMTLQTLDLAGNPISDISSLRGLTSLTDLNLGQASIVDIAALSGMTGLTTLQLSSNSIEDIIPLSGLTSLVFLDLQFNPITDISALGGLTDLVTLFFQGGSETAEGTITDITALAGLTSLMELSLRRNPDLTSIRPLLDNVGFGAGDWVDLNFTGVSCADIAALEATGVFVYSACP